MDQRIREWITNVRHVTTFVLAANRPQAEPPPRHLRLVVAKPGPGSASLRDSQARLQASRRVNRFEDSFVPSRTHRRCEARAFKQIITGSKASGQCRGARRRRARAGLEDALHYAQQRRTRQADLRSPYDPIMRAEMGTKIEAARLLVASRPNKTGKALRPRSRMAKLFATDRRRRSRSCPAHPRARLRQCLPFRRYYATRRPHLAATNEPIGDIAKGFRKYSVK